MKKELAIGSEIFFVGEGLPYTVKAVSDRYAIVTRLFDKKEDRDLIEQEVKMGGFFTKQEAERSYEGDVIYSILDFHEMRKAPNNLVFNDYDYKDQEDIDRCLSDLICEKVELSRRNGCGLIIDWERTKACE